MKRSRLWPVLPVVIAAAFLGPAPAGATQGTTITPFSVTYPDGVAHCTGVRIERAGAQPLIRDVETCVTTLTVLAPGRYVIPADTPWCSDFNGLDTCNPATRGSLTVVDAHNGTFRWMIVADFAAP